MAVGVPRSTLYRWQKRALTSEPAATPPAPTPATARLGRAVERLRLDHPMWGKEKLGPILANRARYFQRHRRARHRRALPARNGSARPALDRKVAARTAPKSVPTPSGNPTPSPSKSPATSSNRHPLELSAARRLHQAFQRLRSFRQMDRRQALQTGHRPKRRRVPRRRPHTNARSRQSHPNRRRNRVHGRVRAGLRRQDLPLYVLPPRSPKLNGAVERCNGAWRYEFYACVDLPMRIDKIAQMVEAFQHLYNDHRSHGALAGKTPAEYLVIRRPNQTPQSHMS